MVYIIYKKETEVQPIATSSIFVNFTIDDQRLPGTLFVRWKPLKKMQPKQTLLVLPRVCTA